MGLLIDGEWKDQWYDTKSTGGAFVRSESQFRHQIGSDSRFAPEAGRYHLYVSYACPWAHRALILRQLKGLTDIISLSVVHPLMGEYGWTFEKGDKVIPDTVNGARRLYEVYLKDQPQYTGRVTVPVLWDKKQSCIVNNESSELIRMLNTAFDDVTGSKMDLYPAPLREAIDEVNSWVYQSINNGVYKAGFATSKEPYEAAYHDVFQALDKVEDILSRQAYIAGDYVTEADWRLFTTLIRFDAVYYSHFKCNRQRIKDYPNMSEYVRALYQVDGVSDTCHFDHIKTHYFSSHKMINPTGIVPLGPELDLDRPHGRGPVRFFNRD